MSIFEAILVMIIITVGLGLLFLVPIFFIMFIIWNMAAIYVRVKERLK